MRRFQSTNEILPCVRVTAVAMPVVDKCWPKLVIKIVPWADKENIRTTTSPTTENRHLALSGSVLHMTASHLMASE